MNLRRNAVIVAALVLAIAAVVVIWTYVAERNAIAAFYEEYPDLEERECVKGKQSDDVTDGVRVDCHEAADLDLVVLGYSGCPAETIEMGAFPVKVGADDLCLIPLEWYRQAADRDAGS